MPGSDRLTRVLSSGGSRPPSIDILVSGGQTGADRAALDVAIRHRFPHGGWCPAGRKAEDGPIPDHYLLNETPSAKYRQRTYWNVRDSDGTVVFTLDREAVGGSLTTIEHARTIGRPCLHLSRANVRRAPLVLLRFVQEHGIRSLNVAGSRESKEPGIYEWVTEVLEEAFFWVENHPRTLGGPDDG